MPLVVTFDASDQYADRLLDAVDAGLIAAGNVYANAVKRGLAGGYTSGDFVTGRVLNSVTVSAPYMDSGGRVISVGSDVDYAMYWEFGHHNIFTRKYERVEVWRPALDEASAEIEDVFSGTAMSYLSQGAP